MKNAIGNIISIVTFMHIRLIVFKGGENCFHCLFCVTACGRRFSPRIYIMYAREAGDISFAYMCYFSENCVKGPEITSFISLAYSSVWLFEK